MQEENRGYVRPAQTKDLKVLEELFNQVTADLIENKNLKQWEYPWEKAYFENWLEFFYVLIIEDSVVGAFILSPAGEKKFCLKPTDYYLQKIAIHPTLQGRGLLQLIFEAVAAFGRKNQVSIFFDCWSGNPKLLTLYAQYGELIGEFSDGPYQVSLYQVKG